VWKKLYRQIVQNRTGPLFKYIGVAFLSAAVAFLASDLDTEPTVSFMLFVIIGFILSSSREPELETPQN
jgi:hypothetical protein